MKLINKNKKAFHDYEILDTYEAGLVLKGSEVKSIRTGKVNLKSSFCKFFKGELFIFDMHVSRYSSINSWDTNLDEKRERKILLHRKELDRIFGKAQEDGISIIPLKIYFNDKNKCKLEIGVCKGLKNYEKRDVQKLKDINKKIKSDYGFKVK